MHESWQTNYNNIKEEIERFEQMDNGQRNHFFDVHTIESIFDFFSDKLQFDKAERIIQIGMLQHPNATSLKVKQAIVLMEKGDDDKAIILMEKLIDLEQSNPEIFLNLGLAYLRKKRTNDALINLNRALETAFDEREEVLLDIAVNLNLEEAFNYTINFVEPELTTYSENESLLFELAYAYDKEFNLEKGLETYMRVIDINPFSENAWYNLGILYIKNGDLIEANECYDFTLALNPNHGEALFNKANSFASQSLWEEAIDVYIEYISLGFDQLLPYHYIADCYDRLDKTKLALKFYRLTIKTDPNYLPAWLGYLACLINHKKKKESLKVSLQAVELHSDYSEFWYLRGRALLLNKRYEEALETFITAFDEDPESLKNFYEVYQVTRHLSPTKQPGRIFTKWLKNYPDSPAINYLASVYYILESKNINKAFDHLSAALIEDPTGYDILIDFYPELDTRIKENEKLWSLVSQYDVFDDDDNDIF